VKNERRDEYRLKMSIEQKVTAGLVGAGLVIAFIAFVSYRSMHARDEAGNWVKHTYTVLGRLDDVLISNLRLEANVQRFLLSGEAKELDDYQSSVHEIRNDLDSLQALTADNQVQRERVRSLNRLAAEAQALYDERLRDKKTRDPNPSRNALVHEKSRALINETNALIASLKKTEAELLSQREANEKLSASWERALLWLGALSGLLFAAIARKFVLHDLADRRRMEESKLLFQNRLAAQYDVAKILAEGTAVDETIERLLEAISRSLHWDLCELWLPDLQSGRLRLKTMNSAAIAGGSEFHQESLSAAYAPGEGLPGGVWASGKSVWIQDLSNDPQFSRSSSAVQNGLKSGFAFPILIGDELLGVVGCYSFEKRERDEQLLRVTATIGRQIGQFLHRTRAEELFSKAFRVNPAPMNIVRVADRIIVESNDSFLRLCGLRREALIGKTLVETGMITDLNQREDYYKQLLSGGSLRDLEVTLHMAGRKIVVLTAAALITLNKELCILWSHQDITERKLAEDALRRSEERYRYLIENADDIIYQTNKEGQFSIVNPAGLRAIKYNSEEITGRPFLDLVHPDYREKTKEFYNRQFLAKTPNTYYEFAARAKDGSEIWIGQNVQLILDAEGLKGFQAVARDITGQRELEKQLEKARDTALTTARLKSEFLANMSHEIRTPMYGVTGMVDLLFDTELSDTQRYYVESIRFSGDQLLNVINDILDFSKIEAGKLSFETIDFDLHRVVERTVETFAERAALKKIELGALISPETPKFLRGDPSRLQQILSNLVGNAVKFTERGEIFVEVGLADGEEEDAMIRVSVTDTGIGIAEESRQILFQPFSQSDGSMARKYGGTGLGLAISSQLVEMMDGKIGVESKPGAGSTFWFTARLKQASEEMQFSQVSEPDLSGWRVLIVDDNATNRRILTAQTSSWGMQTEQAENGAQTLERLRIAAARGRRFDLVILDYGMPDMNGVELACAIRADPQFSDLRLILLSSIMERLPDEALQKAGIAASLTKPIRRADLLERIALIADRPISKIERNGHLAAASPNAPRQGRILIVDDNAPNRIVTLKQVESMGFKADVAESGAAALEAIARTNYSLVLMDCQMPVMDGFAATAAIRAREGDERNLIIIALTANALQGEREHCLKMGMDDYLTKPIQREALSAALDRWFAPDKSAPAATRKETFSGDKFGDGPIDRSKLNEVRELQMEGDPDIVLDLIVAFLQTTTPRIAGLQKALTDGNIEEVHFLTHTLRGSAGLVGAVRMAKLSQVLESQFETADLNQNLSLWRELSDEFSCVRAALEAEILDSFSGNGAA
jgi:two-component system sensor histidine kinase/response regulator